MPGEIGVDVQSARTTAHHAKYFAWELTRRRAASEEDRLAQSLFDASVRLQQDIRKTETEQRRQRQDIFAVEDEIEARRDALIAALQKRLHRASRNQSLFVVRWSVV